MRNKAYTLTEAVIVIAIITLIGSIALFSVKSDGGENTDLEAKSALVNMLDISDNYYIADGEAIDISNLSSKDKISSYVSTPSNSSKVISYLLSGNVIIGGVYSKSGCYYVRRDYNPSSDSSSIVWAFKSGASSCSASDISVVTKEVGGRGGSPDKPILL